MELTDKDLFKLVELILYKQVHLKINDLPKDPRLDLLLEKINYEIAVRMVNGKTSLSLDQLIA